MTASVIARNIQLGFDPVTDKNITIEVPDIQDGSLIIRRGTVTTVGADLFTIDPSGATTFSNFSYTGTLTGGTGVINIGSGQIYKDASGKVGIGTSTPVQKFHVRVGADANSSIQSNPLDPTGVLINSFNDANNQTRPLFLQGSYLGFSINGTEAARIDAAGNLGLGVTPSAWGTPSFQLGVTGLNNFGSQSNLYNNTATDATNTPFYIASLPASNFRQVGGDFSWLTAPSGTAGDPISFTQAMTLTNSGNLGVGTSSPTAKLEVNTGVGGIQSIAKIRSSNVQLEIGTTDLGSGEVIYNAFPSVAPSSPSTHIWQGGSTELARITSSGNLHVGGFASPGEQRITSFGNITTSVLSAAINAGSGQLRITNRPDGVNYNWAGIGAIGDVNANNSTLVFYTSPNNTSGENSAERARITPAGNLLVGTTVDSGFKSQVAVAASASNVSAFEVTNKTNASLEVLLKDNVTTLNAGGAAGNLVFSTISNERARITPSGNLLVGTTLDTSSGVTGAVSAKIVGNGASAFTVVVETLNTPYSLGLFATAGVLVIRDNTTGGSAAWLLDPNGGAIQIASNISKTITFSYNNPQWVLTQTAGAVPTTYAFSMFAASF